MPELALIVMGGIAAILAVLLLWAALRLARRRGENLEPDQMRTELIAEQVRTVGKLIGLEVSAKEIATARKGLSWLPPLVLSQARLAMIFQFEKQYAVDLARVTPGDVVELEPGRFRLTLPEVEGSLRLTNVSPYDIQDGRVLGLLDVIQMNAPTQQQLMERAQHQAAQLFETNDRRYLAEARASVERQIRSLLSFVGVESDIHWRTPEGTTDENATPIDQRQTPSLEPRSLPEGPNVLAALRPGDPVSFGQSASLRAPIPGNMG